MEMIPEIRLEKGVLIPVEAVERRAAHSGEKRWHPTTLILVSDGEKFALVDKYPKNRKKAELYGYRIPEPAVRPDVFGGHIQWEQLSPGDIANGISSETFLACAKEELSEEVFINGAPARPEDGVLSFLGMTLIEEEKEISAVYQWITSPGISVSCQDDASLPAGGRIQIPLPVFWLSRGELQTASEGQKTDSPPEEGRLPVKWSTGLAAVWKVLNEGPDDLRNLRL